jgi:hypothetical protein
MIGVSRPLGHLRFHTISGGAQFRQHTPHSTTDVLQPAHTRSIFIGTVHRL